MEKKLDHATKLSSISALPTSLKLLKSRLAGLTTNKKLKSLCTFEFAKMIDSISKKEVTKIFRKLCTLLLEESFGDD